MAKRASKETPEDKLAALKAKHYTPESRDERIARALQILNLPGPSFGLDKETWVWVAQEADIADI